MKLGGYGEDRLVAELTGGLAEVGDDCAVVSGPGRGKLLLLKTDAVVEGVHFLPAAPPERVGRKAIARAASDIAAMGGTPRDALVTLAVGADRELAYVKGLYAGLRQAAAAFGIRIVGGETCRTPGPLVLSVALTGEVAARHCVRRSGGRPGDWLYVTGTLGGALAGKHLEFAPRLREGRWLAENFRLHAMMDLSDGLAADLPRLALASCTDFEIDADRLPLSPGCAVAQALGDGEDYELLFAVTATTGRRIERRWPGVFPHTPLTRIGRLLAYRSVPGRELPRGYDHFA